MKPAQLVNTIGRYLLYILLIITPLLRGSVLPWHKTVIEIYAFALLAIVVLKVHLSEDDKFQKSGLEKPLLAFLLLYVGSAIFSQSPSDTLSAAVLLLSYGSIFYASINLLHTRRNQRELVYLLIGIGMLLSIIAIIKSISSATFPWWNYEELRYPKEMFSGPYGNHNHLAGYLEMVIPLSLSLYLTRTRKGLQWLIITAITLMLVSTHILTLSRGGWFSLGIALVFMALVLLFHKRFKRKKLLVGIVIAVSCCSFFVLSGSALFERALTLADEETVVGLNGRILAWRSTLEMANQYPVFGSGPGTFASIFPQVQKAGTTHRFFNTHNDYLQFIATMGWLIVPIIVWAFCLIIIKSLHRLMDKSRQNWGIALGALTGCLAIAIHSCVDFNYHIPANAILITILLALIYQNNFMKYAAVNKQ